MVYFKRAMSTMELEAAKWRTKGYGM